MTAPPARRRETFAERRARRAEVDDPELVLNAAVRFLEARARSVAEVRRRLRDAGYRVVLVDGAIARLLDLGMLDDEAFARGWVESRDRARPRGEIALRRELALKGVDRIVVDGILEERRSEAGEAGSADRDADAADRLIEGRRPTRAANLAPHESRLRRLFAERLSSGLPVVGYAPEANAPRTGGA